MKKCVRDQDSSAVGALMFTAFGFLAGYLIVFGFNTTRYYNEINSRIETARNKAPYYTTYVNGEMVDGTKIDMWNYTITINDDAREIYLTRK